MLLDLQFNLYVALHGVVLSDAHGFFLSFWIVAQLQVFKSLIWWSEEENGQNDNMQILVFTGLIKTGAKGKSTGL